ncbi:hypothetical protein F2Q70_00045680 [Brassica cretica]|uniref:Uncharacterized protein n=1 Tax=Brassica cretica TaxID=69181 RepID=A0A8S9KHR8_BRACR|nr:hypothetical protein F2Q70_00045680 [Brassica cretica]
MVTDLAGEAQFRSDDRRRPQNGLDIRREIDRRSRKATLMKNGDCNRRETRRVGESPRKKRLTKAENQISEHGKPVEMRKRRSGRRLDAGGHDKYIVESNGGRERFLPGTYFDGVRYPAVLRLHLLSGVSF